MVNLDNDTRKTVMAKISGQDYAPMLFHEAAKVVYKMVETDVFRYNNKATHKAQSAEATRHDTTQQKQNTTHKAHTGRLRDREKQHTAHARS